MDNNESQDERRKEGNEIHHPWKYKKDKVKNYLNFKQNKSPKNMRRGGR
jgi:hypothetical protein